MSLSPPKSTGRELFNMPWLNSKLGLFSRRPQDVQATLQQFTAATVAAAVRRHAPGAALHVCGGAHNAGVTGAEGARILGGVYRYARWLKLWVRQVTNRVRRSPFLNERH